MAKKAGRPPGSQNKVGKEMKEFIKQLLGDHQQEMYDAYDYYAKNSKCNADDRKYFLNLSVEMAKMITPKPVEVDMSMDEDNFKALIGMAHKFNDED